MSSNQITTIFLDSLYSIEGKEVSGKEIKQRIIDSVILEQMKEEKL